MSQKKDKKTSNLSDEKRSFNKSLQDISNHTNKNGKFNVILDKKLKIFRVSPFYNFLPNKLKFYESKLNEYLNSNNKVTSNFTGYRSKFTLNNCLKLSDYGAEALQVEIIQRDSQTKYVGHFLSWNYTMPDVEDAISLPILLVEVRGHEINQVHSFLCKMFDCDIQPVTFSSHTLITFFVKLLETARNNVDVAQEQVTLEYKIPDCEVKDKVTMSLFLESTIIVLAVIMDSIREKYPGITDMEIVLEVYNKILNHAYYIFKMDLSLAELQKVVFPDAFLTSDGQLKFSTDDAALSTLEVLRNFVPLDAILRI